MKIIAVFFSLAFFSQPAFTQASTTGKPFVLGVIHELESIELGEKRTLNVYLPEGYGANDTARYSVIYLLDGSADEDFIHVVGLVQFNAFSWVNRVPKSIVVGIANVNRRRDFTYPTTVDEDKRRFPTTGNSERFIRFIENELQPFVERSYRTSASKTLVGQSLGGLLATEILFRKSALFTTYVIISPSLWWDNGSLLNEKLAVSQNEGTRPLAVYIGVGKEGLTPGKTARVAEVDANVLAEKVRKWAGERTKVYFDYLPDEDHATVAHQALLNAFRKLYSGKN